MAKCVKTERDKAVEAVPGCVELDGVDGTFEHVVFRVEHVVSLRSEGEDFYSLLEAKACQRWLRKYAPGSDFASCDLR